MRLPESLHVYEMGADFMAFQDDKRPKSFLLKQNYPNPFNPVTTIEFSLPKSEHVKLDIYNALGERVASLVDEKVAAGIHRIEWDGHNVATGTYFYKIETPTYRDVKRLILLK